MFFEFNLNEFKAKKRLVLCVVKFVPFCYNKSKLNMQNFVIKTANT